MLTERVVDTEVETTVDDDTNDRGDKASVETGNTVRLEGLAVDINETVKLAISSTLGRLSVVRKTSTSVVKRVDEEQRRSTSGTTGGDVATKPSPVALRFLETEQGLKVILCGESNALGRYKTLKEAQLTESEVQGLSREVTDNVGRVTPPQRNQTLILVSTRETVDDTLVGVRETALLDLERKRCWVRGRATTTGVTVPSHPGSERAT